MFPKNPNKRKHHRDPRAPLLGTVVGTNENGEPLIKVHLTPEQRILLERIKAEIESLPDDEEA